MTDPAHFPDGSPEASPAPPTYRLQVEVGESVTAWAQRVLITDLDAVIDALTTVGVEDDEAVHRIRQAMKRCRAVLRLIRCPHGYLGFRHNNLVLRGAARSLSPLRSAAVHRRLVTDLADEQPDLIAELDWRRLAMGLDEHLAKTRRPLVVSSRGVNDVMRSLGDLRERMAEMDAHDIGSVEANMVRLYRRGRREMAAAVDTSAIEDSHRWRKSVKYLRHVMEGLYGIDPEHAGQPAEDLAELGRFLGKAHDLAELETVVDELHLLPRPAAHREFSRYLHSQRRGFESGAQQLGARAYRLEPKEVGARFSPALVQWAALA